MELTYLCFMQAQTSMISLIDSIVDATLNFRDEMHDIFVADITRCYESIPLHGDDNLLDAVAFIVKLAFRQASINGSIHSIYIKIPIFFLYSTWKPFDS